MQIVTPVFLFLLASTKGMIAFRCCCLPWGFLAASRSDSKFFQGIDATLGDDFAPLGPPWLLWEMQINNNGQILRLLDPIGPVPLAVGWFGWNKYIYFMWLLVLKMETGQQGKFVGGQKGNTRQKGMKRIHFLVKLLPESCKLNYINVMKHITPKHKASKCWLFFLLLLVQLPRNKYKANQ